MSESFFLLQTIFFLFDKLKYCLIIWKHTKTNVFESPICHLLEFCIYFRVLQGNNFLISLFYNFLSFSSMKKGRDLVCLTSAYVLRPSAPVYLSYLYPYRDVRILEDCPPHRFSWSYIGITNDKILRQQSRDVSFKVVCSFPTTVGRAINSSLCTPLVWMQGIPHPTLIKGCWMIVESGQPLIVCRYVYLGCTVK